MARIFSERTGAFHRRRFELVKEAVSVPILASDLLSERGQSLRRSGERWRGPCPVCGHGASSGAFSCGQHLFYCFRCGEGGDVVKLADLASGFDSPSMACAWIAHRYGVELPERPEGWYRKQERQERTRQAIYEAKRSVKRRRIFATIMVPLLDAYDASEEEIKEAWKDFKNVPVWYGEDDERAAREWARRRRSERSQKLAE